MGTAVADPGVDRYGGSLVLDAPPGAVGTFTVGFFPVSDTDMIDGYNQFIRPMTLTPAVITILCETSSDCGDSNACTLDLCSLGACEYVNTNEGGSCDDGEICTINDECTGGVCAGTLDDCDDSDACTEDESGSIGVIRVIAYE